MVTSGCLGAQATCLIPSASSLQLFSILGISWAIGFCLFSSFHGVSLWTCIPLAFTSFDKESCRSSHIARKSYSFVCFEPDSHFCLSMVFNTFITRVKGQSLPIHDSVCLFHSTSTPTPLSRCSLQPFGHLCHPSLNLFPFCHTFSVMRQPELHREFKVQASHEFVQYQDLFSNTFLIIPNFLFVFWTTAEHWDHVFMEPSIIYCFKFIFFVVFHLPFYCLDTLSCEVLLPSFIVCPHPSHLEYLQIIRNLCHWTAQPLFQLVYGYIEQYGTQHRRLAEHLWWLLTIARTDHLLLKSVCSLFVNYLSVQNLPSLPSAWVQAHRYVFVSLMLWRNA